MNMTNKRCGECGAKGFVQKNVRGLWRHPWKDYPSVHLTRDLELWVCQECGNTASTVGDAQKTDAAIEASIRDQTSQFLDIIKSKSGLKFEEIATRLGVDPSWISSLRSQRATPSFHLWNLLKVTAIDPKVMTERLDPSFDIVGNNVLLRA